VLFFNVFCRHKKTNSQITQGTGRELIKSSEANKNPNNEEMGAYLFAHMLDTNYGALYYSVSLDGINWKMLNKGLVVNSEYIGHPDICKGRNSEYLMIGFDKSSPNPILWKSDSLILWEKKKILSDDVFTSLSGYTVNQKWLGAPKLFYDKDSDKYMICWHAYKTGINNNEQRWESMRSFYVLTSDFNSFTVPQRLFEFTAEKDTAIATIDAIIRKTEDGYFSVLKDERWPKNSETGKTVRISFSDKLTGPYLNPGMPITPAWYEAPSIVKSIDGEKWYLYAENYPNKYVMFSADSLNGKWTRNNINMEGVRHGCVITISKLEYNKIILKFEKEL